MLTDEQRIALLRSDRRKIVSAAPYITRAANLVAVVWLGLLVFALMKPGAEEAAILLAVLGLPVFLFWLLGLLMPKIVKSVNESWS